MPQTKQDVTSLLLYLPLQRTGILLVLYNIVRADDWLVRQAKSPCSNPVRFLLSGPRERIVVTSTPSSADLPRAHRLRGRCRPPRLRPRPGLPRALPPPRGF